MSYVVVQKAEGKPRQIYITTVLRAAKQGKLDRRKADEITAGLRRSYDAGAG